MIKYPMLGVVNGRSANIGNILSDEIIRYLEDEASELYDDIIKNNEGKLFDIVMNNIELYPKIYGYDSLDEVDVYGEMRDFLVTTIFLYINDYINNIMELMIGSNWQDLAKNEYEDEDDVIETFYNMSKMSIDDAFKKCASIMIDEW